MERLTSFVCIRCGGSYPVQTVVDSRGCPQCHETAPANLHVAYCPEARAAWDFTEARRGPPTLWRYQAMLPIASSDAISLGEGMSPLMGADRIGARLGIGRLLIKDESRNPTWSYKDRLSTVAVSAAKQAGAKVLATSSSGNAGASLAAYAARAGLPCVVVTFAGTASPMMAQIKKYGAMVIPLSRKADRWPLLASMVDQLDWFATSPFRSPVVGSHPLGIEGYKTLAYEVVEQMDGEVPDWCVLPVCYGDALAGMWRGFSDLMECGVIRRLPRMVAAEVHGSLTAALASGSGAVPDVGASFDTLAVSIGASRSAFQALRVLRQSDGRAVAVGNDGLIRLQEEVASVEGVLAELTSVTPFAAIERLRANGTISATDTVVAVATAGGLKDLDRSIEETSMTSLPSAGLDEALAYLGDQYGFEVQQSA